MRKLISLIMLVCSTGAGQSGSIMVSGGGQSIVVSGSTTATVAVPPAAQATASSPETEPFVEVKPYPKAVSTPPEPARVVVSPTPVTQRIAQRFLVSESWCPSCPAAKSRFLSAGNSPANVLTMDQARQKFPRHPFPGYVPYEFTEYVEVSGIRSAASPVGSSTRTRLPVVDTQWGRIDLQTYRRDSCNCAMCRGIRALQQQYRSYQPTSFVPENPENLPAEQQPTPDLVIDDMLSLMGLTASDTLADIGCGDGRILIAAARRYGCRGIGIEIDETQAQRARQAVSSAGLAGQIQILTGDARDFVPKDHGVTAITVYLYPELLAQLAQNLKSARVVASPFHEVPGLNMSRRGDVWITTSTSQASSGGFPGFDRQAEIDHLMDPSTQHAGRFRRADLERMSDWQLIDLHNREHGVITRNGERLVSR